MVTGAVSSVISSVRGAGALAGVHICANGDWSLALESDADIISFDAYSYFDSLILYEKQLTVFLARGGILAWGIVSTGDPAAVARESVESLSLKWDGQLKAVSALGFSGKQLMEQTLITPACGTGSLDLDIALKVLALTCDIRQHL